MFMYDNHCGYLTYSQMQHTPWIDKSLLYHWPFEEQDAISDETNDMSNMFSSLFGGMFGNSDDDESSEEESETEEELDEEEEDSNEDEQLTFDYNVDASKNNLTSDEN